MRINGNLRKANAAFAPLMATSLTDGSADENGLTVLAGISDTLARFAIDTLDFLDVGPTLQVFLGVVLFDRRRRDVITG